MATEQELAARDARIAELERNESERVKSETVARELARYELASPAAAEQVRALILPTVGVTKTSDGRSLVFGKDYSPLESVVAETLRRPDFAHYLKPKGTTAPPASAPGQGPEARPAAPAAASHGGADEPFILPGENLGGAVIRRATTRQASLGDPRLDPSQSFGIRRPAALPK